jgi:hypothetical protein
MSSTGYAKVRNQADLTLWIGRFAGGTTAKSQA